MIPIVTLTGALSAPEHKMTPVQILLKCNSMVSVSHSRLRSLSHLLGDLAEIVLKVVFLFSCGVLCAALHKHYVVTFYTSIRTVVEILYFVRL